MANIILGVIIGVGTFSLLINCPLALQIGAFNLGVYGKTKSSKSEVVSIITEVMVVCTAAVILLHVIVTYNGATYVYI